MVDSVDELPGSLDRQAATLLQAEPRRDVLFSDTYSALVLRNVHPQVVSPEAGSTTLAFQHFPDLTAFPLRLIMTHMISGALDQSSAPLISLPYYKHAWAPKYDLPSGALNHISRRAKTWEDVEKYSSRSDFDLYTAIHDEEVRVLFDRWMRDVPKAMTTASTNYPGQILLAESYAFSKPFPPRMPLFPPEALAPEDEGFLASRRRKSPLGDVDRILRESERFRVKVLDALPAYDARDGRSFACRLISIDDVPTPSDTLLRLKICDDRLIPTPVHPGGPTPDRVKAWWDMLVQPTVAEELIAAEDEAFRALTHVQGSILAYYFGAHLVREVPLLDGTAVLINVTTDHST